MSNVDYAAMSDQELKQYFLAHRNDQSAFEAYMDRRHQKQKQTLIAAGEIDRLPFDEQVAIVAERLQQRFGRTKK